MTTTPPPEGTEPREHQRIQFRAISPRDAIDPGPAPCGDFVAGGHSAHDPACQVCTEANSGAPDWTL